jgi:hypothetical protein
MEAPSVGHILSGGSGKNRAWVGAPILARAPGRRLPGRCTPRLPVLATTCRPAARPLGARPGLRVPPYRLRRPAASTACLCAHLSWEKKRPRSGCLDDDGLPRR